MAFFPQPTATVCYHSPLPCFLSVGSKLSRVTGEFKGTSLSRENLPHFSAISFSFPRASLPSSSLIIIARLFAPRSAIDPHIQLSALAVLIQQKVTRQRRDTSGSTASEIPMNLAVPNDIVMVNYSALDVEHAIPLNTNCCQALSIQLRRCSCCALGVPCHHFVLASHNLRPFQALKYFRCTQLSGER